MKARPIVDEFRGDNSSLRDSIEALIELNDSNSLVPHGIGGHARTLLASCYHRLHAPDRPLTRREQFAMAEQLGDLDHPDAAPSKTRCEALAGPMPVRGAIEQLQWEARWRAALRVMRADALIAALEKEEK